VNKMKHEKILIVLLCVLILCALALAAQIPLLKGMASAEGLPDSRVYEMVTPPENHDADVYVPLGLPSELVPNAGEFKTPLPFQAATNGEAVAYVAAPTVNGTGNSGLGKGDEYLSKRLPQGGWGKPVNLQPLGEKGAVANSAFYQAFSSELTLGILDSGSYEELEAPLLSPLAPGKGYTVLYSHALRSESYQPFFTAEPSNRSAIELESAGLPQISRIAPHQVDYAGASANYEHLLFEANGVFNGTGAANGNTSENNLYESVNGNLSLVNVLPGGGTEAGATFGAKPLNEFQSPPADFSNIISEDGSRVYWTDLAAGADESHIFVRENPGQPESPVVNGVCTVPADACTVPVSAGPARYWAASADGRYSFYTEGEGEEIELYRFDIERGPEGTREALTAPKAGVQGVVGTSKDGSTLYFVAQGILAENPNSIGVKAEQGADNLYMLKEGAQPIFVAVLTPSDGATSISLLTGKFGEIGDWTPGIGHRTAEVTPDGEGLVFMSDNQPFGGHSEELEGRRFEEVYVYDAEDGQLSCASCARDGLKLQMNAESLEGSGPDGESLGLGAYLPISSALTFQPTLISEDGAKVFFDSDEPLVTGDTNGEQDVYEWEREGSGGCGESGGCVYLLSGGDASTSSFLIGADATGNNVFFVTRAQLAPEDENENYDVYDARVDGLQRVSPPACSGTGCQGVPASAPTFATPSSVTFEGVGNFAPPVETTAPATPKVKTRPPTNAQKLAKALKACRKDAKGKQRASCEKQARAKYGKSTKKKGK
jgi:hypothetical protein